MLERERRGGGGGDGLYTSALGKIILPSSRVNYFTTSYYQ